MMIWSNCLTNLGLIKFKALSKCLSNTDRPGAWSTSSGSLSQCLATLSVNKEAFPNVLSKPPGHSFEPFPCVLPWIPGRRAHMSHCFAVLWQGGRQQAVNKRVVEGGREYLAPFLASCWLAELPSEEPWLSLAIPARRTRSDTGHGNATSPSQPRAGSQPPSDVCWEQQLGSLQGLERLYRISPGQRTTWRAEWLRPTHST